MDIRVRSSTRRWRTTVVLFLAAVLVASVGVPRSADAEPMAPPAAGWQVVDREAAAGIEVLSIRRDAPLARGKVVVMPRSGLHRLRTVLASEQMIGGARDLPTNLCARVHCHAAINGDRWDEVGHDAGRLTGAVAVDGELIATQPLPPAKGYGHLLVGHDGSLRGTIDNPIPVAPTLTAGSSELSVAVNRQPTPERMSLITRRYSTESRTPPGTVEYLFSILSTGPEETVLEPLDRRESSGPIPASAVVVAANGPDATEVAEAWWAEAVQTGRASFRSGLGGYREVIGGAPVLLVDGAYHFPTDLGDGRQPRTVVGWDETTIWLVTVDGRRPGWSGGVDYVEAAQLLRWLGATDALNLDGGGSTALVGFGRLRNWPSDGVQRRVASVLVLMPPENRVGPPPPARSLDPACPPDRVPPNRFPDADTSVHVAAIACMSWWDLTTGTGPGTYDPALPVRRDQMASFLARYLFKSGVALPSDPPDAFGDDDGSVHEPAIDALAALGVIGGRADGRYVPAASVTRGQMATFLARAVPLVTGTALPHTVDYFADDSGDLHEPNINAVTEAGVAGGTGDGQYQAGTGVRRDQMASFLARTLSVSVEAGRATPPG